jgi:hypothetical protein
VTAIRWIVMAAVAAVVLVVLFTVVFPWIEQNLSNPTLGTAVPVRPPAR